MDKKVTIHDIAREAGVSAATVSYIINNRTDKSISDETRQRVLQIINLYNYKPAAFAKNLRSTPDSKLIALYTGENDGALYGGEFLYFVKNLSKVFPSDKYGLILSHEPYRRVEQADAIIACNIDRQAFAVIGNLNYVPLIAVDCMPNDTLFFQITTDYLKVKLKAEEHYGGNYAFVCLDPADDRVREDIVSAFSTAVFVRTLNDLRLLSPAQNIVTVDRSIAEFFEGAGTNVFFPETLAEEKCKCVFSCLERVLKRIHFDVHFYKI